MAENNSTDVLFCIMENRSIAGTFHIIIVFCALPFHVFIAKILAIDSQFDLPRHKILFSLSLSDATKLFGMFIAALMNKAVTLTVGSTGCMLYRGFAIFIAGSTLVVSCVSIIAMSVERYIACIYSFHLHQILTESRVRYGSIFTLVLGGIAGLLSAATHPYDDELTIPNHSAIQYIDIIFIIPTSVATSVIQVRLFIFSREKTNRINRTGAFGEELELADYRKKQIKVAFMAGIVAFAFFTCMIPIAVVFLYELLSGVPVSTNYKILCLSLSFINNLADPFIYGLGSADIRQKIIRELKNMKQFSSNWYQSMPAMHHEHENIEALKTALCNIHYYNLLR